MTAGIHVKSFLLGTLFGAFVGLIIASAGATVGALLIYNRRPVSTANGSSSAVVEGTWYEFGDGKRPTSIGSRAGALYATNNAGMVSRLVYDRSGLVVATEWEGGLRGDVRETMILWANGTFWTRTP